MARSPFREITQHTVALLTGARPTAPAYDSLSEAPLSPTAASTPRAPAPTTAAAPRPARPLAGRRGRAPGRAAAGASRVRRPTSRLGRRCAAARPSVHPRRDPAYAA